MTQYAPIAALLDRLSPITIPNATILPWACPVPYFGRLDNSRVATVGINPSSREFIDASGAPLSGGSRRLPTLDTFAIASWLEADSAHVRAIATACDEYFTNNPYDLWFRVLDGILARSGDTLYGRDATACHLDVVPYATSPKWGSLPPQERKALLNLSVDSIGRTLLSSQIEVIILNGRSVVEHFLKLSDANFTSTHIRAWDLKRSDGKFVEGRAYRGSITEVGGVTLDRAVTVLGHNHNLQSSFGVTKRVLSAIGQWYGDFLNKHFR